MTSSLSGSPAETQRRSVEGKEREARSGSCTRERYSVGGAHRVVIG